MSLSPKILYIDDEEDLVMLAKSFFEEEGLALDICTDFQHALDKIKMNSYDLIISDSRMPQGSGKDLFHIIKSQHGFKGSFILVTGNIDFEDEKEKELYDLILYKPLQFQDLVTAVKKFLLT